METLNYIELNSNEQLSILVDNIFKFFVERKYIDNVSNINSEKKGKLIENKSETFNFKNKKINIQIILNNIKNIQNGSSLDDYLSKNLDHNKILIVKDFNKKVYNLILTKYVNCEIFFFHEFMEHLPDKDFIPKHELLSGEDKEELIKLYSINNLAKIQDTDIMCRYYGGKINDIFRIQRPNINSGHSIFYRVVIKGDHDILF